MTGIDAILSARRAGLYLYLDSEKQLQYLDPKGVFTAQHRAFLEANGRAIREKLEQDAENPFAGMEEIFPLPLDRLLYTFFHLVGEEIIIAPDNLPLTMDQKGGRIVYTHSEMKMLLKQKPSGKAFHALHRAKKFYTIYATAIR